MTVFVANDKIGAFKWKIGILENLYLPPSSWQIPYTYFPDGIRDDINECDFFFLTSYDEIYEIWKIYHNSVNQHVPEWLIYVISKSHAD